MITEIKVAIVEHPVREGGTSKQRRSVVQCHKGFENKRIRNRGGLYMVCQSEIKGIDDHGIREDGSMGIVGSGVEVIFVG